MTSCSAPRPLRWCIIVWCCKHPRLEAVPAPAFSQMFAAPGYAWTTAEGEAVKNTCAFIFVSVDRDELPPHESSWLVGVISWNLDWNEIQSWCMSWIRIRLPWNDTWWWTSTVTHEPFTALSIVCCNSFCYLGMWGQIIIKAGKYLAGLCVNLLCPAFAVFSEILYSVSLSEGCAPNCLLAGHNPRPKSRLKTHCPVCFCCSPNPQCISLSVVWFVLPPPWFAFHGNNSFRKYSFRNKSSLVQFLNNLKQSCHQEQYLQKGFSFPLFSVGSARAVAWILPGISFLLCFTLVVYFWRDGQWE